MRTIIKKAKLFLIHKKNRNAQFGTGTSYAHKIIFFFQSKRSLIESTI